MGQHRRAVGTGEGLVVAGPLAPRLLDHLLAQAEHVVPRPDLEQDGEHGVVDGQDRLLQPPGLGERGALAEQVQRGLRTLDVGQTTAQVVVDDGGGSADPERQEAVERLTLLADPTRISLDRPGVPSERSGAGSRRGLADIFAQLDGPVGLRDDLVVPPGHQRRAGARGEGPGELRPGRKLPEKRHCL